jgi:predicted RNA-binding Zn ribbon-like protein
MKVRAMWGAESKEWVDGFLFIGNQPALDLLNTVLLSNNGSVEMLPDTKALKRWLIAAGLISTQRTARWSRSLKSSQGENFLKRLREFRTRLRAAVLRLEAGKPPTRQFLAELNGLLRTHPSRRAVVLRDRKLRRETVFEPSTADHLWGLIAAATESLLCDTDPSRIRKCESCIGHFYDASKKGSRRWCSMKLCGNKVKVAAYKKRQRITES